MQKAKLLHYLKEPVHAAPLAAFRVFFGLMMLISVLRFWLNGWIESQYIKPLVFFKYYGFHWVEALPGSWMYLPFILMGMGAIGIALGWFYRWATVLFFLCFTYVELIDATNYLNHYYFVSLVAFLLICIPAHHFFSLDAWRKPRLFNSEVPRWYVGLFRLQLGIVYFYAGLAKINADWWWRAEPLKTWLPAKADLPLIGELFRWKATAYLFSWTGCLYDLLVPFALNWKALRLWAYAAVVVFHVLTALLFQIGVFPYIMIALSLIYFPASFHLRWMRPISSALHHLSQVHGFPTPSSMCREKAKPVRRNGQQKALEALMIGYVLFQLLFPWRYLAYTGPLFWHEQGYRFSWRVMLMEKAGHVFFYTRDAQGKRQEIPHQYYLTPNQEKMLAVQPDFMLQMAERLAQDLKAQTGKEWPIYVDSYATLNGSGSQRFVKAEIDLCQIEEDWSSRNWITPFHPTAVKPLTHRP